jgi:3-hydroxyisobutyrate dehydrogenase-like beta-hydroxyacid dehydrogenase
LKKMLNTITILGNPFLGDDTLVNKQNIGILHPGQMGISIAASAQNSGNQVYWVSAGRSAETHQRASKHVLLDAQNLRHLCETCSIILCICPPHAAENVANQVIAESYEGFYVDANAISPERAIHIEQVLKDAGITFVDGSIIGGPAWEPGRTWLYLSGKGAEQVASCFSSGPLETQVMDDEIGKASAIKMCFAAYTKGRTALLSAILGTAEALGVRGELENQWSRYWPNFNEETTRRVQVGASKAWRFVGEMEEISTTFQAAGLPGGFHAAAADLYRRLTQFKDDSSMPLEEILNTLIQSGGTSTS